MEKAKIRCEVSPGQFSSEYAVAGRDSGGEMFSLFAPAGMVEKIDDRVGWLDVKVYEVNCTKAVVQLPRESFEQGRFVTVPLSQFKTQPQTTEAG